MEQSEFDNLKRGDILKHKFQGESYVIDHTKILKGVGLCFVAVKTVFAVNPSEWEKV